MKQYADALIFSITAHNGQFRKHSRDMYIVHPVRVSEFILRNFSHRKDLETLRIIALLHDVIEDTWVEKKDVEKEFGKEISGFVQELTKDKSLPKKQAVQEYAARVGKASDQAKIVKLADIYDNTHDTLPKEKTRGFPAEGLLVLESIDVADEAFRKIKKGLLKKISLPKN